METAVTFRLLLVVALVAGNGFFVISEFALVRVRATRLRELAGKGHASAQVALRLVGNIDRVLSGVQLGVTMFSLALGWAGESTIAALLMPLLAPFLGPYAAGIGHSIALGMAFVLITITHIIFGELIPKNLALARSDDVAMMVARPMEIFIQLTYPLLRFVDQAAARISLLLGARSAPESQVHSAEELKMLIAAGREVGVLPPEQEAMIRRLFDLDRLLVREVMVPRPDMVSIPIHIPLDGLLKLIQETNYSRFPVWEGAPDKFIGSLSTKELFRVWINQRQTGTSVFPLRLLLRPLVIVPETKPLDELLLEFRARRRQMALVVDEYGHITGLVTVEDVLEAVVGEIEDEFDLEERPQLLAADSSIELEGATSLLDLESLYRITLPRDQGFETLAGFALWRLGSIPKGGEGFDYQHWHFTVLEMERRRIARLRMERLPQ